MKNYQRTIKSFALRQGRMSKRQKAALDHYSDRYLLSSDQPLTVAENTYLEIGFGMGDSLCQMAKAHPENHYIGVEVHRPGVGALLDACVENNIDNIRVFNEDVNVVLAKAIPEASLAGVFIFFPDPWPKKRHHKRRLVQPPFIDALLPKIKPGGLLHLATDWAPYAEQMMTVLSAFSALENAYGENTFATETPRFLTKFEQRGKRLGHKIWDLVFIKKEKEGSATF